MSLMMFSKIAASDMQAPILGSQMNGSNTTQVSSSITIQNHIGEITRPTFTQSSPASSTSNGVKGKGMQLGAKSHVTAAANASLADQLAEEAAASSTLEGNPWGTDDLIDVNADEDDWGKWSLFLLKNEG
jgi:SCY1-like protein 1